MGTRYFIPMLLGGGGSAGATTLFLEIGIAAFAAGSRTGLFKAMRILRDNSIPMLLAQPAQQPFPSR